VSENSPKVCGSCECNDPCSACSLSIGIYTAAILQMPRYKGSCSSERLPYNKGYCYPSNSAVLPGLSNLMSQDTLEAVGVGAKQEPLCGLLASCNAVLICEPL
jgi:hypothetical protein